MEQPRNPQKIPPQYEQQPVPPQYLQQQQTPPQPAGLPPFDQLMGPRPPYVPAQQPGSRVLPPYPPQPAQPPVDPVREERRARRRSVGAAFLYFGVYLGVQLLAGIVLGVVLMMQQLSSGAGLDPAALTAAINERAVLFTGITNLVTLLIYLIIFAARRCNFLVETRVNRVSLPALLLVIPLAFTAYVLVAAGLSLLPERLLSGYAAASESLLGGTDWMQILCVALIAPVTEEILFRALFYTRLRRGMPRVLAILLASAVFGLMHGQIIWMAYAFLLSLLLIGVLEWYGSLLPCILLHVAFNAAEYVVPTLLGSVPMLTAFLCAALLLVPLLLLTRRAGLRTRHGNTI